MDAWADPSRVLSVVARERFPVLLDSADPHVAGPRFAVVACRPTRVLRATFPFDPDPFEHLRQAMHSVRVVEGPGVPYGPGWIGYLGYEAGRWLERLPATTRREIDLPDVHLALYDTLAVADLAAERWTIVSADLPLALAGPRPPAALRARRLAAMIRRAATDSSQRPVIRPSATISQPDDLTGANRTRFLEMVRRAREYIRAGDIFQVNLSHQLRASQTAEPPVIYERLRRVNPAHYGAFLGLGTHTVLSASPELFLMLRGRDVITRPIKGTRPRSQDTAADAENRRQLMASEKDHAELAMIVDLERNDLGRVCQYGSIRVVHPWALETHPTIYHLVSTIAGRLQPGCDAVDLLRATFPGGSITGAPKIRAMQIVDELEASNRSVYCGAIGHIGLDRDLTLNIAIRTILADGRKLHIPVGSGIVADSVPEDEYEETLAKGAGLLAAVTGANAIPMATLQSSHAHEVLS